MSFIKYKKPILFVIVVIITLLISFGHFFNLSYEKPVNDQLEFLALAYNSLKYGTYDDTYKEITSPDYSREPIYPLILMIGMLLHPGINLSTQDAKCIIFGEGECIEIIIYLKIINIIFLIATALLSSYIVYRYTRNVFVSGICFFLISLSGSLTKEYNEFLSEVPSAFLITLVSVLLCNLAVRRYSHRLAFIFGLFLGALVLIKAIFFYFVFLCSFFLLIWSLNRGLGIKQSVKQVILVVIGAYILIGPWQVRNYIQLGTSSITERSGIVLLSRAYYNVMLFEDYYASILYFARDIRWVEKKFETSFDATVYEKLNPTNLIQYNLDVYKHANKIRAELDLSAQETSDFLLKEAKQKILANFGKHLAMVVPFAIRGSFFERGYGFYQRDTHHETIGIKKVGFDISKYFIALKALPNVIFVSVFFGTILLSFFFRRWDLIWFLFPGAYSFGMHAFFTHFIPRYSESLIPIFVICSCIALWETYLILKTYFIKLISFKITENVLGKTAI